PAKKPRTECCCQWVARMMAAIVAPSGRPSMASTRACFDPGRLTREEPALVFALPVGCLVRTDFWVATEARLREATTLTAGASTSVRSGAGLTLVSVGAPTASSLTPIASKPCLVMRSAMGPASASRRQASSEPLARTSCSRPVRMSLSTAFRTASPVTFAGRSTPRSLRREAVDRMTSWVSVSVDIGILHCVGAASFAATTAAPPRPYSRRGRIPRHAWCPERSHYRSVRGRMPVLSGRCSARNPRRLHCQSDTDARFGDKSKSGRLSKSNGDASTPPAQGVALVRYNAACRAIAAAARVDEVKNILDVWAAMREYARRAKNNELVADAVEIQLRATRKLGQIIQAQKDSVGLNRGAAGGGKKDGPRGLLINPRDLRPTLASQGIDKNLAHGARRLAERSETAFEHKVAEVRATAGRVVPRAVREVEIEQEREARRVRTAQGGTVADLYELIASGYRAGAIAIDAPWPFE